MVFRRNPEVVDHEEATEEVQDDNHKHIDKSISISMTTEDSPLGPLQLPALCIQPP